MKIKIIDYGYEKLPFRAHNNDAGADVYSNDDLILEPNKTFKIPLGFGLDIPNGYVGFIFPRSSLSAKGIICELPPIDAGYTGEIHAIITNHTLETFKINKNDRIGQLVIMPCVICDFITEDSDIRGIGAFGSTGK